MKRFPLVLAALACSCGWLFLVPTARAGEAGYWTVASPDHEQTFAYGTEQNRVWVERGHDHHLAVLLSFTNDPYVDQDNPRQVDHFTISFPGVRLGKDGRTFFYYPPEGGLVPVAIKRPDFLGIDEVRLLPHAEVLIEKPHGYLSLSLAISG